MDNTALNKAIAERVIGYTIAEKLCAQDPETGQWDHIDWYSDEEIERSIASSNRYRMRWCYWEITTKEWMDIPNYCSNVAAAFDVVAAMAALGFRSRSSHYDYFAPHHEWIFSKGARHNAARCDTPALAICRAALQAIHDPHNSVQQSDT